MMKNEILISCIIPIYNVAPYIIQCLESVYNQTYRNIEVILVDDCGNDNSLEIINQYLTSEKLAITTIIHHNQNKGLSAARNTGINHAKGEWVYFLDSDDYLSLNCFETFVHLIQKYNNSQVIFGTAIQIPHEWTKACISVDKANIPEYTNDLSWIRKSFIKDQFLPITAWNKLIKKDFLIQNKLFFKEGIIYEDNLWNWKIGNKITTITFNKEITYFYRYVYNSIINKPYTINNMRSETIIIQEMFKTINYKFFFHQLIFILHFAHSSYCRRKGNKKLEPSYFRYPKAFIFFLKCIFQNTKFN
ncbi:MAG: glycosyltransferase family 2 protein [Bacteroidaceae bacterium]|nr:glycosyltransferase family 2 protein [Bacteroidaceae bacterium]